MSVFVNFFRRPDGWVMALGLFVLAGCATPKIHRARRVGNPTFDQAVLELGPPDKHAKLSDGSLVADWLTRRRRHAIYATGNYGDPGWPCRAPDSGRAGYGGSCPTPGLRPQRPTDRVGKIYRVNFCASVDARRVIYSRP